MEKSFKINLEGKLLPFVTGSNIVLERYILKLTEKKRNVPYLIRHVKCLALLFSYHAYN